MVVILHGLQWPDPQGTVLEPLLFLLYINDITRNVKSSIHLFANDCILSMIVSYYSDLLTLSAHGQTHGRCISILSNVIS